MQYTQLAAILAAAAKRIPQDAESAWLHKDLREAMNWADARAALDSPACVDGMDPALIRVHGAIETPEAFMKRFTTPCDDEGNIETAITFRNQFFPIGTHREAIWLHLEKTCPGFSVAVAMGAAG